MILSVLIPTIPERAQQFHNLFFNINFQIEMQNAFGLVEVITDDAPVGIKTIGQKRNDLMSRAKGDYVCFIDDDDKISKDYIRIILKALKSKPDNLSLLGIITWKGNNPEYFEHSIMYNEYKTTNKEIKYERYPNHLNVIKYSIASQFKFPETNFGEDTDWATQIFLSGLLKKEVYINEVLYHYNYTK